MRGLFVGRWIPAGPEQSDGFAPRVGHLQSTLSRNHLVFDLLDCQDVFGRSPRRTAGDGHRKRRPHKETASVFDDCFSNYGQVQSGSGPPPKM